jgi:TonB family protein
VKANKNKIYAILGTILFHIGIVMLLFVLALRTPLPLPGEEGILVDMGYMDEGTGMNKKPQPIENTHPSLPEPEPTQTEPEQEVQTQDTEEAPAMPDKKEEKTNQDKETEKKEITDKPKEKPKPKEPEKPKIDPRSLYKGKSNDTNKAADEGQTNTPGDQGSSFGQENISNKEGQGGMGEGISFSLAGRKAKHVPKPAYNSSDQGKVVVTIWVDKYGKVTRTAISAKGTTVTDTQLWKQAREAAQRAKFSTNLDAPEIQKGTITYNFIIMN